MQNSLTELHQPPDFSSDDTLGVRGEKLAATYLQSRGLQVLERNWRHETVGEVDLICRQGTTTVFVEVKTRREHAHVNASETISPRKLGRLKVLSQIWLSQQDQWHDYRIDLFGVTVKDEVASIVWHRGIDR